MSGKTYDFGVDENDSSVSNRDPVVEHHHDVYVHVFHNNDETTRDVAIDILGAIFFCCMVIWIIIQLFAM